jgi:O-antigen ligase
MRPAVETNAHNEYLEMAAETGLVGAVICAAFLLLLFRRAMMRLRNAVDAEELGIRLGAVCAWIGICVYAITDFPTVIPATDYVLAVLAALAVADIGSSGRRAPVQRNSEA